MSAVFDFKPDPNAASPLYMQLAQALAQAIRDGVFHADEALPSERVLAEQLDLSRVTARKAIDRLVEQGLIIRKRGSGNYIAPKLEQPLTVTVRDVTVPVVTVNPLTLTLGVDGTGSVNVADVVAAAASGCGVQSSSLSRSFFTCADLGAVTVTATVPGPTVTDTAPGATVSVTVSVPGPTVTETVPGPAPS